VDDTFLPDTAGGSMTLQWVAALLASSNLQLPAYSGDVGR